MKLINRFFAFLTVFLTFFACKKSEKDDSTLFISLPASKTGVNFSNDLTYSDAFNIFTYRNYYNGGGVALGDINNDGLLDIYFTGNQVSNRLYLNKGDFQFEDITEKAGVAGTKAWSTGVSMVDINGDGWIDIYVCNSGDVAGDNKQNELFINNGDGTFTERAEEYGLADQGFSTHAVFFDYDNDGDLDVYLLNNSYTAIGSFNKMQNERPKRDPVGGDKLYRNDGGKFVDVSEEAGIYGSVIGFGLGVTVGDANKDGWLDIFISNDFFEKDYLYINNGDGTFSELLEDQMRSISAASMGADMADINNDGFPDIFVTDMLPEPDERLKQVTTFENWDKYVFNKEHGYHYQYSRNMLHLNNGNGTFSEIGRLAGVEATDWSWGALIFDMDNDGKKDIFVANGIYQDITDLDYLNFIDDPQVKASIITPQGVNYRALIDPIPITPIPNYAFQNQGDLRFENKAKQWGLDMPIHSNGSAYGDLNNDGGLDLVINNVNATALIYKNRSRELRSDNNYLKIELRGKDANTQALGAAVYVHAGDELFFLEQMPIRGFQSTVDPTMHFGLGKYSRIDRVTVVWPDGKVSQLENTDVNQTIIFDWKEASDTGKRPADTKPGSLFREVEVKDILDFKHEENVFVDFDRERLTYHMISNEGPAVAFADINGDGLEDIFMGGAKGSAGKIFLQQSNGSFKEMPQKAFETDKNSEDTYAVFFDANGDGFIDLLVASGGNEYAFRAFEFSDRLYLNDGKGDFSKADVPALTANKNATSKLLVHDFDGDGVLDVMACTRVIPFNYGVPASSYIFLGDGKGGFREATAEIAPELKDIGMVTDATLADINADGKLDVILVGEWMSPELFIAEGGSLQRKTTEYGWDAYKGWYMHINVADLNGDGKPDILLGNHGENSRFRASTELPIYLYVNDFDRNGSVEQIYARQVGDRILPYTLKHELDAQVPSLKKKHVKYAAYNKQDMSEIFEKEQLASALRKEAFVLSSGLLLSNGDTYQWQDLPREAQFSITYSSVIADINQDGHLDIVLGGNLYRAKPQVGKYDASYGTVLLGNGKGGFSVKTNLASGLVLKDEIRHLVLKKWAGKTYLMAVRNNDTIQLFEL